MTAVPAPSPAPVAPGPRERHGWHIPTWAAVTGGVLLLVIAGLGVLRAARLHRRDRFDGGFGRMGDHMRDGGHVHWVLWIVVIVAAVAGIALLVAASRSRRRDAAVGSPVAVATAVSPAEQILAERFARGEIDEAEFRTRRDALRS